MELLVRSKKSHARISNDLSSNQEVSLLKTFIKSSIESCQTQPSLQAGPQQPQARPDTTGTKAGQIELLWERSHKEDPGTWLDLLQ